MSTPKKPPSPPRYPPNDPPQITNEEVSRIVSKKVQTAIDMGKIIEDKKRTDRKKNWARGQPDEEDRYVSAVASAIRLDNIIFPKAAAFALHSENQQQKGRQPKQFWLRVAYERCKEESAQATWDRLCGFAEHVEYPQSYLRSGKKATRTVKGFLEFTEHQDVLKWQWNEENKPDPKYGELKRTSWDVTFSRFKDAIKRKI